MTGEPASALYEGTLRHRRAAPVVREFTYPLFMMYLDLDELAEVFAGRWLWSTRRPALARFRRRDYLGDPAVPLGEAVRRLVAERTGRRPAGPIRLLTHLRYYGHGFNPVSFYYCFDPAGERVEAVVAEITNTPWNERHCYVLSEPEEVRPSGTRLYALSKQFHVSPFLSMEQSYRWSFTEPGEHLVVHMENFEGESPSREERRKLFDATLSLKREAITGSSLARVLVVHPWMTLRVVFWIYWQAFRLWLEKVPFHVHPARRGDDALEGGR